MEDELWDEKNGVVESDAVDEIATQLAVKKEYHRNFLRQAASMGNTDAMVSKIKIAGKQEQMEFAIINCVTKL